MEWPAEVAPAAPFRTRLVVTWGCGAAGFKPGGSVDQSAVTFAPYFVQEGLICPLAERTLTLDIFGSLDTAAAIGGLQADFSRTYEMRAASSAYAPELGLNADPVPIRTFGDILVRMPPDPGLAGRKNAAGRAYMVQDSLGCLRLQPLGLFVARSAIVIENPSDTTTYFPRFVRGYIYDLAAPLCGETRVFHLVTVN